MAKALLGFSTGTDPHLVHRLVDDNRALRQRVADLEDLVTRLHQENDALAAVASAGVDEAVARDGSLARA